MSQLLNWPALLSHLPLIITLLVLIAVVGMSFAQQLNIATRWIRLRLKWPDCEAKFSSLRDTSSLRWEWLTQWTNRWKGYALNTVMLGIVFFAVVMFALVPFSNHLGDHPIRQIRGLYVIKPIGSYDYWMRTSDGLKIYVLFCKDFGGEPPFDAGETIAELNYRDMVACWSVKDMHPAFVMERDRDGNLTRRIDNGS